MHRLPAHLAARWIIPLRADAALNPPRRQRIQISAAGLDESFRLQFLNCVQHAFPIGRLIAYGFKEYVQVQLLSFHLRKIPENRQACCYSIALLICSHLVTIDAFDAGGAWLGATTSQAVAVVPPFQR